MAAFNYPDIVSDQLDTWLNGFKNKVKAFLNAIPGASLVAGSVTVDKLAKQKSRFCVSWCAPNYLVNASVNNLFCRQFLNSDGGAATYQIVGWSVSVNQDPSSAAPPTAASWNASALTKSVTASITVHKAPGGVVGAAILTIDISTATTLAFNVPLSADLSGAPISVSNGDVLVVRYNWATTAGAVYPGLELCLDMTLQHAGT